MKNTIIEDKIYSWVLGGAIGDAMWAPTEMLTQEEIIEKYDGRVTDYQPTKENGFFKRLEFPLEGGWYVTDDTILSMSLMKSYSQKWELDLLDILETSWQDYENFPYGFGGATRYGLERVVVKWKDPSVSGKTNGAGNGVIMKQFPLAVIHHVHNIPQEQRDKFIEEYTRATHNSNIAVVGSILHDKFLTELLEYPAGNLDVVSLLFRLKDFIIPYEEKYLDAATMYSSILDTLTERVDVMFNALDMTDEEILDVFGWKAEEWDSKIKYRKIIFKSGYVVTSLAIVYALFLRKPDTFDAIVDAVNIGWDTDSYAAMVGNMVWAYTWQSYADQYINGLQSKDEIVWCTKGFISTLFAHD